MREKTYNFTVLNCTPSKGCSCCEPNFFPLELSNLCTKVQAIAKSAGQYIFQERKSFDPRAIEFKGLNDMVSYVDKEAEQQIVEALHQLLPAAGFIAEEGSGEPSDDLNWIIDPLDGTTNFIHNLPYYSVSIGLAAGQDILLGVVYDPCHDECFYATKGGGAWCNHERISISPTKELGNSLLVTGFPYHSIDILTAYMAVLQELVKKSQGFRRLGSAAIDLAYVACGRFEVFFEHGLKPWDVAGGAIIVKEAGGLVTDFHQGEDFLFGQQLIAGQPQVHLQVQEIVSRHFK